MKTQLTRYSIKDDEFLKINNRSRVFTLSFLERLAGHKLSDYAPIALQQYGCIRVTKNCVSSYYAGEL